LQNSNDGLPVSDFHYRLIFEHQNLMNDRDTESRRRNLFFFLLLAVVTAILFSQLFNRENSLSYSIGYNLYGAERVLDGEIPYRDFHTLYPPATLYLNAGLFKLFGITLFNALFGVLIFKALTTLAIYLCASRLMPYGWALLAASFSLFWLRPNGPFKAVPMHYGALFLAIALFLLLSKSPNRISLIATGLALGVLALFKHNIGAYALAGGLVVVMLEEDESKISLKQVLKRYRQAMLVISGFVVVVIPVLIYLQSKGALGQMIQALLFGPGEFLLNRLAAVPSPFLPALFFLWLMVCAFAANYFRSNRPVALGIYAMAVLSVSLFLWLAKQDDIDPLIFYLPVMIIAAGLYFCLFGKRLGFENQRATLAVTVCAAAAFMEAFPRFAREQAIASMPFIALLLLYILYQFRSPIESFTGGARRFKLALAIFPLMIFLIGARLFLQTYFDNSMRLKSDRELTSERGRGVYFPTDKADELDQAVAYIKARVPADGYFFAQSYAGSSYLFLADRKNPSGAQFWGGVGVKDAERIATLEALKREQVNLIVTSNKDLAAEKYQPMRDFISENFKLSREFGETLILER
jgi:hypothetical protein